MTRGIQPGGGEQAVQLREAPAFLALVEMGVEGLASCRIQAVFDPALELFHGGFMVHRSVLPFHFS